jgi:peptidoglycan/LPS O-acetylase OafA/YrhL
MGIKESGKRIYFLDNLKVALTALVIAHHAGQPYGGSNGFWYYKSKEMLNLGPFFGVNAAFFMSLFFMISAYFLPASFDKKGARVFIKERFKRLGPPLLFGFFIMIPVLMYTYYIHYRSYPPTSFFDYYINIYFGLGGRPDNWTGPSWPDLQFAHLWFIEHLLVYALIYTVVRILFQRKWNKKDTIQKELTLMKTVAYCILISFFTFFIRIWYPIDKWVGFLGVIQTEFAHVPQYAGFFLAGILAYRNRWMESLSPRFGKGFLIAGMVMVVLYYAGFVSFHTPGGPSWQSLAYSFYETFLCASLCIGFVYLFREYANRTGKMLTYLASSAFTVYVIHVPIVVGIQYSLTSVSTSAGVKFIAVTFLGIAISFLLGHLFVSSLNVFHRKANGTSSPSSSSHYYQ